VACQQSGASDEISTRVCEFSNFTGSDAENVRSKFLKKAN
jgi:hypothetical protein